MRVLGISPLDKDSTVSFMEDGRVVFACAEERLSRVKLQDGFPHRAMKLGLERTGVYVAPGQTGEVNSVFDRELNLAYLGEKSVKDACETMKKEIDAALKKPL